MNRRLMVLVMVITLCGLVFGAEYWPVTSTTVTAAADTNRISGTIVVEPDISENNRSRFGGVGGYISVSNVINPGDNAMTMSVTPAFALDSFRYIDTINSDTLSPSDWTSPLQTMTITPGVKNSHAYGCTVIFIDPVPDESLYFAWTSPASNTTIDTVLDSLVHYFNNTTNLKDSVVATEDGADLTITAKFSEITFGTRLAWAWSDSLKDTSETDVTVAMVCDSMVVAINADAGVTDIVTAIDSTTFYIITADVWGTAFTLSIGDTTQDTTSLWVNADTAFGAVDMAILIYTGSWGSRTITFLTDTLTPLPATSQFYNAWDSLWKIMDSFYVSYYVADSCEDYSGSDDTLICSLVFNGRLIGE